LVSYSSTINNKIRTVGQKNKVMLVTKNNFKKDSDRERQNLFVGMVHVRSLPYYVIAKWDTIGLHRITQMIVKDMKVEK